MQNIYIYILHFPSFEKDNKSVFHVIFILIINITEIKYGDDMTEVWRKYTTRGCTNVTYNSSMLCLR